MKRPLQKIILNGIAVLILTACSSHKVVESPPEFKDYYDRVRNQVDTVWPPLVKEKFAKLYSEGMTVAPRNENCESLVGVDVQEDGKIVAMTLLKPCGIKPADDAALEAFQKISTLPPPPKKVLKSGVTQVKWNFVLLK